MEKRKLVKAYHHGSVGMQWIAGDEPLYYIVSPRDVIILKPRNADDNIA